MLGNSGSRNVAVKNIIIVKEGNREATQDLSKSLTTERPREQRPTHSKSLVVPSKEREMMLGNSGSRTCSG